MRVKEEQLKKLILDSGLMSENDISVAEKKIVSLDVGRLAL